MCRLSTRLSVETHPEERERSATSNREQEVRAIALVALRLRPDGLAFWARGEEASLSLHDGKKWYAS